MNTADREYSVFKRAMIISAAFHLAIFILLVVSPYFPKLKRKETIFYVNAISLPGGGGGGSAPQKKAAVVEETVQETPVPQRETLRDLTTSQALQQENQPKFRYPVDKPKKEKKPAPEKKQVIQKAEKPAEKNPSKKEGEPSSEEGSGEGTGVRLGIGSGPGGGGTGSGFSDQIGLTDFPYSYYLDMLIQRISNNWIKQSQIGQKEGLHTTVTFKIFRNGTISTVEVEEASGIRTLDLKAIRAITDSAPFAPLPEGYEEEYLRIHLMFEHSK